jgi:predicted MFS family arabinose efflux permease
MFGISGQLSGTVSVLLAEKMVQIGGFRYFFILCAVASGISLLLSLLIRETVEKKPADLSFEQFLRKAMTRSVRIPFLTTFLFSMGITSYIVFLKPYTQSIGLNNVSYFFLPYTIAAIAVRLIIGDYPDRYGPKSVLYPALFSLAFGMFLIVFLPNTGGLIASGIFCGLGHGLVFPSLSTLIISRGGESYRGGFMTLYTLVFDLGALLGSPLLGLLVKGLDYRAIYFVAAVLVLSSVAALYFLDRPPSTARD